MLRILSGSEKKLKPIKEDMFTPAPDDTISESGSQTSERSSKKNSEEEQHDSQVSFCSQSKISSSNPFKIAASPAKQMETPGETSRFKGECNEPELNTKQENIQSLFDKVKSNAMAMKAAAKRKLLPQLKLSRANGHDEPDELLPNQPQTPVKSERNLPSTNEDALLPSTAHTINDSASTGQKRSRTQTNLSPKKLFADSGKKRRCVDDLSNASANNAGVGEARSESNNNSDKISVTAQDIQYIKKQYDLKSYPISSSSKEEQHIRTVSYYAIHHFSKFFIPYFLHLI